MLQLDGFPPVMNTNSSISKRRLLLSLSIFMCKFHGAVVSEELTPNHQGIVLLVLLSDQLDHHEEPCCSPLTSGVSEHEAFLQPLPPEVPSDAAPKGPH